MPSTGEFLIEKPDNVPQYSSLETHEKLVYIKEIFRNAIPTVSAFLVPLLTNLISLHYLTKYGQDELVGGYGLGAMFSTVFVIAWIYSFNQAANVFISQAFGAQDYSSCNRYFRRGLIILGLLLVPLSLSLRLAESIMLACGVDAKLAAVAGTFTRLSIPMTIGCALFDSMKSFMMGQRVFQPILYIQLITLIFHFGWANLFINTLQMGIKGAVICRTIEEFTNAILIYLYIRYSRKFIHTWKNWDKEILNPKELWKQFKFAFNIAIISYVNWIYFEIQTLMAGSFNARQVVVHIAIGNTSSIMYDIALGVSITLITMVGNSLGERNLTKAKNYLYAGYTLIGSITAFCVLLLLIFIHPWACFWSLDPETQDSLVKTVMAYITGSMMVDGVNNGLLATLKSVGKERQAMFGVFFSLYMVSVPVMFLLAFVLNWQVLGLWIAFSIGNVVFLSINIYNFKKIDWEQVQEKFEVNKESIEVQHL